MKPQRESTRDWIGERFAVAVVSSIFAALTLFLYPLVLSFFAGSHGGGGGPGVVDVFAVYYRLLFSKVGLLLTVAAGVLGFFLGPERMATVFGFLWGTDPWWSRASEKMAERLSWIHDGYSVPDWVAVTIVCVLGLVVAAYVHKSS